MPMRSLVTLVQLVLLQGCTCFVGPTAARTSRVQRHPSAVLLDDPSVYISAVSTFASSLASSSAPPLPAELAPLLEARQAELVQQLGQVEQLIQATKPPAFPFDLPMALNQRDLAGPLLAAGGLAMTKTLDWRGSGGAKAVSATSPFPTGRYDPQTSQTYYAARPLEVLSRVVSSALPASGFGLSLLLDWLRGPEAVEANSRVRAEQLVTALTAMGPTYIKVGQALSIRADLLSPAYISALTGLQDRVPAFSSDEAKAIMAKEWGLRDVPQGSAAAAKTTTADAAAASSKSDSKEKNMLAQIKDAGVAGAISYAFWEVGFWGLSAPVALFAYYELTGHWPDFGNSDDVAKLGAEAFAFINVARFAVPVRIGLALSTVPWFKENVVDRFGSDDKAPSGGASGAAVDQLFSSLSAEPVAAASLGQVYKGVLREDGREVAIKVQRPGVEGGIALDLLLIRAGATAFKSAMKLNTDLVGLVDDWGRGFVDELDYELEAGNAVAFEESIADSPLAGVVTAPKVDARLSTKKVLVTDWIDGERLEKSQADDVSKLCGVALNTYLTMLLSTGLLHCDPHPGNLLRTSDGKLCILDWGLVTRVDEDLQLTFLEHVAHLTSADYDAVPGDLIKLGFVPAGMESALQDNPEVVETLASVYSQWAGGGGVAKIDVNEVSARLQGLTEEYGNFFQVPAPGPSSLIPRLVLLASSPPRLLVSFSSPPRLVLLTSSSPPSCVHLISPSWPHVSLTALSIITPPCQIPPYFAYVLRAFSVLEGIALINDPDYSILNECLPYISQRVLTDNSPRATEALGSFVYTKVEPARQPAPSGLAASAASAAVASSSSASYQPLIQPQPPVLDAQRLSKLAAGFTSFSASSGGLSLDSEAQLERLASQIVDLLLAREGSPLQDLLLDEAARLADASTRDQFDRLSSLVSSAASSAPALVTLLDPLGVVRGSAPLLGKYEEDERVLEAAAALSAPLLQALPDSSDEWAKLFSSEDDAQGKLVRFVAGRLWERRADAPLLSARLAGRVLLRGLTRVDGLSQAASTLLPARRSPQACSPAGWSRSRAASSPSRQSRSAVSCSRLAARLRTSPPRRQRPRLQRRWRRDRSARASTFTVIDEVFNTLGTPV